ncbi:hypothetical protein WMY93_017573 [Mugilogobius chulae]|uniref:Uncharacterized protein n=1 Tax=Mugilogobius chulae TaxID=88201 RepID=A0AAW0NP63_9GOBI
MTNSRNTPKDLQLEEQTCHKEPEFVNLMLREQRGQTAGIFMEHGSSEKNILSQKNESCFYGPRTNCDGEWSCGGSSLSREAQNLSTHFLHLFQRIVPPACPGTCLEHLIRENFRKQPKQMPDPSQLALLTVKEKRLYPELLPD